MEIIDENNIRNEYNQNHIEFQVIDHFKINNLIKDCQNNKYLNINKSVSQTCEEDERIKNGKTNLPYITVFPPPRPKSVSIGSTRSIFSCRLSRNTTDIFPPLDTLLQIGKEKYTGPTAESNWVIPGKLMVGAYPAAYDDKTTYTNLASLMRLGIGTFVCLQEEYDSNAEEKEWRSQHKLRPYFRDVGRIFKDGSLWSRPCHKKPKNIDLIHFPMKDLTASSSDIDILNLCIEIIRRIELGEIVYVHCWGGHGRAGIVCSVTLAMIYKLRADVAMKYIQAFHDCRVEPLGVTSPQTIAQHVQVGRIIGSKELQQYWENKNTDVYICTSRVQTSTGYLTARPQSPSTANNIIANVPTKPLGKSKRRGTSISRVERVYNNFLS